MHVVELNVIQTRIRLKRRVRHASFDRRHNDSLLVRCRLSTGEVGWGEGLPRTYVTGESIDSAWDLLTQCSVAPLTQPCRTLAEVIGMLTDFTLPKVAGMRDCFGNSARCAVELAILDAYCRALRCSLRDVILAVPGAETIANLRKEVQYSGVITTMRPALALLFAAIHYGVGFRQCKVKVGAATQDDVQLLAWVRRGLRAAMDLRIDANAAWQAEELLAKLEPLRRFNLSAVEQPVPHDQIQHLAGLRPRLGIPVVLDESLCSLSDGQRIIDAGLGDVFNIRLSKCGGLIPSVHLAIQARRAGLGIQLGCQVGETGILSAAGRHFATSVSDLVYVEGSFDRLLVQDRITREDITFGLGGRAPALPGPGLGVTIEENAVQRACQRQLKLI